MPTPGGGSGGTTGTAPAASPGDPNGMNYLNNGGAVVPPSTAGGSSNPIISQDQSAFSQYVLGQIQGNPVTIGNLGGGITPGQTTIGQAIQEFSDLPPSELQNLEMQLWDAGFYVNGDGSPMSAADIHFGVPGDPASWTAFTRALGEASTSNTPFETLLSQRSAAGGSTRQQLPQAVTGGGNTYQIDLSNPTSVKYIADQVFQSALGRNATDAEAADITSKLRGQETQQGLTQEAAKEQQSQAGYQVGVNQRNIAYQNQANPNIGGQVPTGPFGSPEAWAAGLLQYMGMPVTTSNIAMISAWVNQTGKFGSGYNPLGSERPEASSKAGAGDVQTYSSWAEGMQGTASMLLNGKYSAVVSALQNGTGTAALSDPKAVGEIRSWSGGQISSLKVDAGQTKAAADAAFYYQQNAQGAQAQHLAAQQAATPGSALPLGLSGNNARNLGITETAQGNPLPGTAGPSAVSQAASLPANMPATTNPSDVTQGQQPPNPGDQYINPVTVYSVTPASEEAQAYQSATTGGNRAPYLGHLYDQFYNQFLAAVSGGPKPAG